MVYVRCVLTPDTCDLTGIVNQVWKSLFAWRLVISLELKKRVYLHEAAWRAKYPRSSDQSIKMNQNFGFLSFFHCPFRGQRYVRRADLIDKRCFIILPSKYSIACCEGQAPPSVKQIEKAVTAAYQCRTSIRIIQDQDQTFVPATRK